MSVYNNYAVPPDVHLPYGSLIGQLNGITIQISPSLKNGDIVFTGGDGFLTRIAISFSAIYKAHLTYYKITSNGVEQLPSHVPANKFRLIELEEEG